MSLLPARIIPQTVPLGTVDENNKVIIDKDWWLLLYNLCGQVLGTGPSGTVGPAGASGAGGASGTSVSLSSLLELAAADSDATDADAIALRRPIQNLERQVLEWPQISPNDLPDIARALLLAQEGTLPDQAPLAQPVAVITPGASPYAYKAPAAGTLAIVGGTVSAIAVSRQGTSVATGLTAGLFPVSRYDTVTVTYSSVPTMTFIPGSSQ
jgi:hypothetical protein